MNFDDKIYIAGHKGLVASAIVRELKQRGFENLLLRTRSELNLINQSDVNEFFHEEKPDYVILAAAKVGGIHANNSFPAEFIYENILIQGQKNFTQTQILLLLELLLLLLLLLTLQKLLPRKQ